ncbi:MAG: sensor domain-containing diguanylate cyclase [Chloroflexota bacterium]|nr:sensor domain-containing diguanylate cyclase [Chloroflexota bacterium]
MKRAPVSPDEATQRDQVRRLLTVLTALALVSGALVAGQAFVAGIEIYWTLAIMVWGFGVVLVVGARPLLARGRVEAAVMVMAFAAITLILGSAFIRPSGALTVASMLVPVTAAVPYLEAKSLRRLMVVTWIGTIAAAAATLVRGSATPSGDAGVGEFWTSALVSGLVLFLLYQSSESLKASNREFRRLFSLSSDLAETTEAGVLGDLVARHLTEATGMDDCVLYSLVPETSRLTPFGSHPAERAIQTEAQSVMERPTLGRVIDERVGVILDTADENADPMERTRLDTLGRRVMLLLPLVAHSEPVGVAELTSTQHRSIDDRRLALARTLAFEAAMAIENGRLYQELHERSLHDPLTGLANRGLFFDRVGHAIARLGRRPGPFLAVLFVDLDNFKTVNDTLGHARGDRLLALVAERLLLAVRDVDTVARLGGDEFAVLLEDLTTEDEAILVAERAVNLLRAPFDLAGKSANASASIGVAVRADDSTGTDTLLAEADAAMYEAKRAGKGRVVRSRPAVLAA